MERGIDGDFDAAARQKSCLLGRGQSDGEPRRKDAGEIGNKPVVGVKEGDGAVGLWRCGIRAVRLGQLGRGDDGAEGEVVVQAGGGPWVGGGRWWLGRVSH